MQFLKAVIIAILLINMLNITFASEISSDLLATQEDLFQKLKAYKEFEESRGAPNSNSINVYELRVDEVVIHKKCIDSLNALSISNIPTLLTPRRLSTQSSAENIVCQKAIPEPYQQRWLLSLDGGGIRGLMQLQIIAEIERMTKKSIIELFDGISGTSIGGIIACLLTTPNPENPKKPKYTAKDLLDIFCNRKGDIFKSKWQSCKGLFGTRYKTTSIKNLLKELLGDNKFSDRLLPTVLVTHNLITNEEQLISSEDAEDFYTWSVALATGAAPTYFKPQRVFPIDAHLSHRGYVLSDGGTCMNNPIMAGIALMHEVYQIDADDLNVLSLGTGTSGTKQLNPNLLRGGILRWGITIVDTCLAGQESATNKLAELYCKDRYHRLNPVLDQRSMSLDDISEDNQEVLFTAALKCIKENMEEIKEVIASLMSSYKKKHAKNKFNPITEKCSHKSSQQRNI